MLTAADLEVNILEFRQRSFQFERLAELDGETYAVFGRTETENERQLRPRLLHLTIVTPLAWVRLDEAADLLRLGAPAPPGHQPESQVVEIAAEPTEFDDAGRRWRREPTGGAGFAYVPAERAPRLLGPDGRAALGLG